MHPGIKICNNTRGASNAVEVSSFPTLVIIDKKGVLRAKHVGFIRGEDLVGFISEKVDELSRE